MWWELWLLFASQWTLCQRHWSHGCRTKLRIVFIIQERFWQEQRWHPAAQKSVPACCVSAVFLTWALLFCLLSVLSGLIQRDKKISAHIWLWAWKHPQFQDQSQTTWGEGEVKAVVTAMDRQGNGNKTRHLQCWCYYNYPSAMADAPREKQLKNHSRTTGLLNSISAARRYFWNSSCSWRLLKALQSLQHWESKGAS